MLRKLTATNAVWLFSIVVGLANGAATYFIGKMSIWLSILSAVLVSAFNIAVLLFLLEFFFYRRIRRIYRNISALKTNQFERISLPETNPNQDDPLENINYEIVALANKSRDEIKKLKDLEQYRKEFIGNVSHELKTPIFAVQGYIDTLLEGAIDDPKFNRIFLQKAMNNADRLVTLVQDLMAISQLETGQLQMEMKPFLIHDLVAETIESLDLQAKSKKITLRMANPDVVRKTYVIADKERIRQVFINLIANSIRYGKEGGETNIYFKLSARKLQISVEDNGIGIAPEHIHRIFERFYRVDKSRSREGGGTGLGLSIVKHILEAHNEPIEVYSEPNVGTTFSFSLDVYYPSPVQINGLSL
ncbi:MAG: ATP-binding protein [Bacteroidia bacterium]|nr:ATP-binding protein [Bacteroidia bacterium]MDW8348289.1 ATP-binding protein [Bacteroidia bacterium]